MSLLIKALNFDLITDNINGVAAVDAIGAIALSPAALPQASAGITTVVRTLRLYEMDSTVALSACKTLGIYLRCPATRERAQRAGADYTVRSGTMVAQIHSTDAKVKKAAEDALQAPQA